MKIAIKILAASVLLAMLIGAAVITKFYFIDESEEPPVGQERRRHRNCTVVTAFFALGFNASSPVSVSILQRLHAMFRPILYLRLPMVVFTDAVSAPFVADVRQSVGMDNYTRIWNISLAELPLWANFSLFRAIIDQELNEGWGRARRHQSENQSVEFHILANSKSYFMQNASAENGFNSSAFAWMDPTYGHGKPSFFPPNFEWEPKFPGGKITLLKVRGMATSLTPANNSIHLYDREDLYRNREVNLLSTEFMAGDRETIEKFHGLYTGKLLDEAVREEIFDEDDQTLLVLLIKQHPSLFNLVQGEWFNAFHLF